MANQKAPSILIETCGKQKSGFIKDGTEHTATPEVIDYPGVFFIPVTSYRKKEIKDENGRTVTINEPIRYIKNCPFISVDEQNAKGYMPNRKTDVIAIEKGYATVERTGDIGLYDYLTAASYQDKGEKDEFPRATKLFKIINIDANSEKYVENEIAWLETGAYLAGLQHKQGNKFIFKEEKIDAIVALLAISVPVDSYMAKFKAIMEQAKHKPVDFMKKVVLLEQTVTTLVNHGLELKLIHFVGNTATYVEENEVLVNLGSGRMSNEQKVEKTADFLNDPVNEEKLKIFKARLEFAKEKQFAA